MLVDRQLYIPEDTRFAGTRGGEVIFDQLLARLCPSAGQRRSCGIGTKSFGMYDWALIASADPDHQDMIFRSLDDGELAFYHML